MKFLSPILLLILSPLFISAQPAMTTEKYREDFNYFWKTLDAQYSYFNKKQTNCEKVKEMYGRAVDSVSTKEQFVRLLEKALNQLYDHHAILNTNTPRSYRLVPSGSDGWAGYVNGKPMITGLRKGFGTESCGI